VLGTSAHRTLTIYADGSGRAARAPAVGEVPIAALIVQDNQILCPDTQLSGTLAGPTAHAEVHCNSCRSDRTLGTWRLTDTTLYGDRGPARCVSGAIILGEGFARVVLWGRDPKAGACGSVFNLPAAPRVNHQVAVTGGVSNRESGPHSPRGQVRSLRHELAMSLAWAVGSCQSSDNCVSGQESGCLERSKAAIGYFRRRAGAGPLLSRAIRINVRSCARSSPSTVGLLSSGLTSSTGVSASKEERGSRMPEKSQPQKTTVIWFVWSI